MNRIKYRLRVSIFWLTTIFLSAGCGHRQQINNLTVEHVKVDTIVPLQSSEAAPTCSLSVNFCYLDNAEHADVTNDSVLFTINTSLVTQLLGEDYATLPAAEAVNRFKTNYLNDYLQDMQELYAADLKNKLADEELPSWYNRSFDLKTVLNEGYEGILCAQADIFEFAGGAHPNTWKIWMNYRLNDGHLLTADEVFIPDLQHEVSERLTDTLIRWARKELDNNKISTVADLQHEGLLLTSELYVPENFLLEKDQVRFVYNRYDIAPYALGAIELAVPYEEIKDFMNLSF